MFNRTFHNGARKRRQRAAVDVLVRERNEPIVAASVVPLQHLIAQQSVSNVKQRFVDVPGQREGLLLFFFIAFGSLTEEGCGRQLATVVGDHDL